MMIQGCRLEKTCGACPEQYDVWLNDDCIGYLRLRHGFFYADYVFRGANKTVYQAYPRGDGIFEYDEREKYLRKAVKKLKKEHYDGTV